MPENYLQIPARLRPLPDKLDVMYGISGMEAVSPVGTRYGMPRMVATVGQSGYLQAVLDVEAANSLAISELYPEKTPPQSARKISSVANIRRVKREVVEKIEMETHHDMGAIIRELTKQAGDAGGYVHFAMTSAGGTETGKARQIYKALGVLIQTIEDARNASLLAAEEWKDVPCIIRTHGQHAIPATFGLPFAFFGYCLDKNATRLNYDRRNAVEGKLAGAIGTYDVATDEEMDGREIERLALRRLRIKPADVSMQIPPRENIAWIMSDLAVVGGRFESMAQYIKTLKRTEILELREVQEEGAMASSAMPHKDFYGNPHIEERCMAIASILRGFAVSALETVTMEDFRDLRASLVDRIIIPEAFVLADYSGRLMENIIYRTEIIPENVERNLMMTQGVVTSQRLMSRLIPKGVPRRDARRMVSINATKAFRDKRPYFEVLLEDPEFLKFLSREEIVSLSDPHTYVGQSSEIIRRATAKYMGRRVRQPREN